jgi:hypothetical protein
MARYDQEPELLSTEEAFAKLTVEHLKPLVKLLTRDVPTRKPELVKFLTAAMRQPDQVRRLYEGLDPLGQKSVQEAGHDLRGYLDTERFEAKYGALPSFDQPSEKAGDEGDEFTSRFYGRSRSRPGTLSLFFPQHRSLPTDLRSLLRDFVPPPPAYTLPTVPEPPATVEQTRQTWAGRGYVEETEQVPLRLRETARDAEHDVRAVLRLVEAGGVRVTDKKRQPTAAAQKAVADVLQGGDFYAPADQEEESYDPSSDLAIKAFAWPMIVQAAGWAHPAGARLELTPAGRKALAQPAHEALKAAWKKWRGNNVLDEFSRVTAIKGQNKAALTALPSRRKAVADGLAACPPGRWFAVDDFFRFLRATDRDFQVARRPYELYIAEHYYGNLGYEGAYFWEIVQGRYVLALLFEYAATLGQIDVAYLPPQGARDDFHDRWGADDYSSMSRYDGLMYLRINPLGAWCLGQVGRYEPPAWAPAVVLKVLPNLDVVATSPPLPPADRLLLERYAEPQSDAVWKLTPAKALAAVEEGMPLDELVDFLKARSGEPLPQTAEVFLDDLRRRAGQLRDLGTARLVECADAGLAQLLASDPQLRGLCQVAGERRLVFRAADEAAVRRALRRLGYVLPPPRE